MRVRCFISAKTGAMKKAYIFLATVAAFHAQAQPLYFPPVAGNTWDTISPQSLNWCPEKIDSLYGFLDSNNTKAFILLKDGRIVLEKYFGTHTQSTPWQWASAGKTITSFMTGIAQQEHYLSIADTTSEYLGQGWTSCTPPQEEKITIRHQLTMTSGLDDGVSDNHCTEDTCLVYKADAGTRWAYHNAPYTLLHDVVESATGMTMNAYVTQKLRNPTGMTGAFVPVDADKVFFSNARSMARFGLLILNRGSWDGNRIMTDTAYYDQMVSTSQSLNESYGYLWWLNGKSSYMIPQLRTVFNGYLAPHAPADMIAAMGKGGQFLNVIPGRNMVWVRMGETPDDVPVPFLLNDEIWQRINDLECSPIGVDKPLQRSGTVQLFPNPASDVLHIKSGQLISGIEIFNAQGQCVQRLHAYDRELTVPLSGLPGGVFFIKAALPDGGVWTGRLVKD